MNIKIGILNVPKYGSKHDLTHFVTLSDATSYGPGHAKTCLMSYANSKGADQSAHLHSLISTFVVRCLDSMICILAITKFVGSVVEQAGLNLTWSKISEDIFW